MAPPFVFEPLRETFLLPVTPGTQSRGTYYVTCPNCKKTVKKGTSCCGSKRAISPSGKVTFNRRKEGLPGAKFFRRSSHRAW